MTFDPKTATVEEFEVEARRLHAERMARIQSMTPEEMQACARFMMDGYLQRAATLRLNELFTVEAMDIQIAKCVEIWRTDNFQSSDEYAAERDRLIEADRQRKAAEASERARLEAAHRNARARWRDQGNDPARLEGGAGSAPEAPDDEAPDDEAFADEAFADEVADADLIERIELAIAFHREKTRLTRNIRQWTRIRDAIVAGAAPRALKAQIERAAAGARPGGRYHGLWMDVRERARTLDDAA